jgi:ascorbate-specific PTS system EIIC-type component UlaA
MAKILMVIAFIIALIVFPYITVPVVIVFGLLKLGKGIIKYLPWLLLLGVLSAIGRSAGNNGFMVIITVLICFAGFIYCIRTLIKQYKDKRNQTRGL